MKTPIKVKVNENLPDHLAASDHCGDILEVHVDSSGYYRVSPAQQEKLRMAGAKNWNFTIAEEYVTVIEEFALKSGMIFLDNNGRYGLIIGTDSKLVAMFAGRSGEYETYSSSPQEYLDKTNGTWFEKIYAGMNENPSAALSCYMTNGRFNGKVVWSRKPMTKSIELNADYTAEVSKDSVTVGCQTIPMDKVIAIVEAAKELQ